ncbi:MAG TPA: GGDEF domain-containing protein [Longimicrobiales bacterium]|nr:GGDEF domain-containing protein [Longimicrobiales bacterium]
MRGTGDGTHERSGAGHPLRLSRSHGRQQEPLVVKWVERLPGPAAHALAAVLTGTVAALDYNTGPELSLSILYLLPVSLAASRLGGRAGMAWALGAAAVGLGVDLASGSGPGLAQEYWNAAVRLGFFLIVAAALSQIRRMWQAERLQAGMDHLTGVLNGRAFREIIELERSRALRYNRPFTLAYLDVDGFKQVNDVHGHSAGDDALQLIATTIRENIRSMDAVARLGGDEFGLLFPETGTGAAETAIRKIQARLAEATAAAGLDLTFSVGAVICVGPPDSVDQLIHRADALMYEVKRGGRNDLRTAVLDENFGIEAILRRS